MNIAIYREINHIKLRLNNVGAEKKKNYLDKIASRTDEQCS